MDCYPQLRECPKPRLSCQATLIRHSCQLVSRYLTEVQSNPDTSVGLDTVPHHHPHVLPTRRSTYATVTNTLIHPPRSIQHSSPLPDMAQPTNAVPLYPALLNRSMYMKSRFAACSYIIMTYPSTFTSVLSPRPTVHSRVPRRQLHPSTDPTTYFPEKYVYNTHSYTISVRWLNYEILSPSETIPHPQQETRLS